MIFSSFIWVLLLILFPLVIALPSTAPQFVFHVIVDDLGWGDVSFHNTSSNQVVTPNMYSLAIDQGAVFNRFYVHKMCTPSRSSFMSGRLPMHVQNGLPNPEESICGVPYNMTGLGVKMKQAGYDHTAWVGKYDAGMATFRHTPSGRGFDESLIYFEHKNDYWDQTLLQSSCQAYNPIVDLWDTDKPSILNGTDYEEYIFRDRIMSIIEKHDVTKSLFLVYTPHVAHCPLQVPKEWLDKFTESDDETDCQQQTAYIFPGSTISDYRCRNQYRAMVALLDEVLGNVTNLLKQKGMWQNTLMVLSSDNGGPVDTPESGSTNYPLRGGKYSDFEGGIRASAFISGGFLPSSVIGQVIEEPVHIADWYGTYCALGDVDPYDPIAAAAGLPPVDSVNLWPLVSFANKTSPRWEIPVSPTTLIQGRYKLIHGQMIEATWSGVNYPNSSSVEHPVDPGPTLKCPTGCLFDVVSDPTEHDDIAINHPDIVTSMIQRLNELEKGFFTNNDDFSNSTFCPSDLGNFSSCGCYAAVNIYNRYFGPWAYSPYNTSLEVG